MSVDDAVIADIVTGLRAAGARFAFLFGSHAEGHARADSDVDVAAWWGADAPVSWEVGLPGDPDLLVLDNSSLELAGRVAQYGVLLFDDDPPARVAWQATTRKIYLDERYRQQRFERDVVDAVKRRG